MWLLPFENYKKRKQKENQKKTGKIKQNDYIIVAICKDIKSQKALACMCVLGRSLTHLHKTHKLLQQVGAFYFNS